MAFTSATFFFFHLAVVLLRWVVPRRLVGALLLLASYAFYLTWGPRYGLLIGGLTLLGWGTGLALERVDSARARKAVLAASIVALLGTLSYFKYADFLLDQARALASSVYDGRLSVPRLDVVLPLGISFYTFEVLSYVVDVYRGEAAERSLARFALYVGYYPHLVAGPIVRAHELLPALRHDIEFDGEVFSEGIFLVLVGLLKKMVIADRLAEAADAVFASPGSHSTMSAWIGVLAYAGQIFCDFSGYTDIARGSSQMLGYRLPDNFDYPYLASSITDFWRRWHMTLSRWLRDYLYVPLGGNRGGRLRRYRNLFLTMLLGGLWHGANWTFVLWGAAHGALLGLHKVWDELVAPRVPYANAVRRSLPWRVIGWGATQLAVVLLWVFFRAPDVTAAGRVFGRLFAPQPSIGPHMLATLAPPMTAACRLLALLVIVHALGSRRVGLRSHAGLPASARGLLFGAMLAITYLFAETRATFIYFQF
ncbi:MAG: MBOAT family O-acyltransferase [Polyangiales bacterium]